MSDPDDEWVTQAEARVLLGEPGRPLGKATVPKLVARGLLVPRRQRPSLRRADVLALAAARAEAARVRALPPAAKAPQPEPEPPDDEHDWTRAEVLAAHLDVGVAAVHQRSRRGRLPFTLGPDGHTRFYILEQVQVSVRSQAATRRRRLLLPTDVARTAPTPGRVQGSHEGDAFDAANR